MESPAKTTPAKPTSKLAAIARLGPSLYIRMEPPPSYMEHRLRGQKLLVGFGAIAMSLVSIGLIVLLLRRFVTNPIAVLDSELTAWGRSPSATADAGGPGATVRRAGAKRTTSTSGNAIAVAPTSTWESCSADTTTWSVERDEPSPNSSRISCWASNSGASGAKPSFPSVM